MRIVVTGGLGFIASHLVRWILDHVQDTQILNLDALTYAGHRGHAAALESDPSYQLRQISIIDHGAVDVAFEAFRPEAVLHLAAESHVDCSGLPFVETNVLGTQTLLEVARRHHVAGFVYVSMDEVYATITALDRFTETSTVAPNSPYSASTAGSDILALAAFHTCGHAALVTRCSNNYGSYQCPEKLIPLFITNGILGQPRPLYGNGANVRDWIHVEDHVQALWRVLMAGTPGEIYNIGATNERTNREVADALCRLMGLDPAIIHRVPDRLGHDRRYAIDATKIQRELGREPEIPWARGIADTVQWYSANRDWWEPAPSEPRSNCRIAGPIP